MNRLWIDYYFISLWYERNVFLLDKVHMWNELTFLWNELTILWNAEQEIYRTRSMHFSVFVSSMPEGNRTKSNYMEQNRTVMVRFSSIEFGNRTLSQAYTKIKSLKFSNAQ